MPEPRWSPKLGAPLTGREEAVLRLVADGLSDPAIRDALKIAIQTVRMHLRHVYIKTGCTNRPELTRYAVARGLVPPDWSPPDRRQQ